ncbi:hypothetical protein [Natrarchaeobaculum sulfurireducens]|nr:hypothetical protein [Natrarchaeobaculum sulfurireducens]
MSLARQGDLSLEMLVSRDLATTIHTVADVRYAPASTLSLEISTMRSLWQ